MPLIKDRSATAPARMPSAQRFQYRARSAEEVKARANRPIGSREGFLKDGTDFFIPPAGDNIVRPLPPTWDGANHYGLDLHVHFGIGPDKSAYLCLDQMKGEPCPLCEERQRAAAAGETALAKHLRPRQRVLAWVINRKEANKGPLAWNMPAGLDKDIVNCSIDKGTGEILMVDDPSERGFDIQFKREGVDIKTEYTGVAIARRPSPLHDDPATADLWLQFAANNPLPSLLEYKSYDEMQAAYEGTAPEEQADTTKGQPAPGASSGARVPARGSRAAPPAAVAAPAAAAAPAASGSGNEELPSWDEVHKMGEDDLTAMTKAFELEKEAEADASITSVEALQDWLCGKLGIAKPVPASAVAAPKGSWKDKLAAMKK